MTNVVLVHGYSVRTLDSYGILPQLLQDNNFTANEIYLSAFDSLNDEITCDDLAAALETRISELESKNFNVADSAFIVHSTGAIITRRWILNRFAVGKPVPSHFISLAGANHGSALAQLGTMQLVYFYRFLSGGTQVGKEVLQDLDFGSDFLLKLNEEWLDSFNAEKPLPVWPFSLIGNDHSALDHQLFWQTHENGSDGTVRISAGNLNYQFLSINQNDAVPAISVKTLPQIVPHLVLPGVSHTGDNGIIGGNADTMAAVFPHILESLNVRDDIAYAALAKSWSTQTSRWSDANQPQCDSSLVFSLIHPGARKIQDSLILIKDATPDSQKALANVGSSIESRQPIQNNTTPSSVSFYVNYFKFTNSYPHQVQIQINSGCNEITYPDVNYTVMPGSAGCVQPNEFTYVKVTLKRDATGTFELIPQSDNPDVKKLFPPMPKPL